MKQESSCVVDSGTPIPKPGILSIASYVGGDITPEGMTRRVVLASNENPFGTNPRLKKFLEQNLDVLHCYPSGSSSDLRNHLANHFQLKVDQIICGNGSEELLHLLAKAYAGPGDEVLFPQYGFQVYKIAANAVGATPVSVPQPNYAIDVKTVLSCITPRTKIIFLDNPSNPLGGYVSNTDLEYLVASLPSNVLLVLDNAYAEFMVNVPDYKDGTDLVNRYPNVVVTRSFSKAYGIAGLRLGWAYCPAAIADPLNRMRAPFNVNILAQKAGVFALDDQLWIEQTVNHVLTWRPWLASQLLNLNLKVLPSFGNFVLCEFPNHSRVDAASVYRYLGENGIMTRPVVNYGLPNHLRISIGLEHELKELIDLLEKRFSV